MKQAERGQARLVVATEQAMRFLIAHRETQAGRECVVHLMQALQGDGPAAEVSQVIGTDHPIWRTAIDDAHVVYLTVGVGHQRREEVRLLYAGPARESPSPAGLVSLAIGGRADHVADLGQVIDARAAARFPALPSAPLVDTSFDLADYLTPEATGVDAKLLEALIHRNMEDLGGERYHQALPDLCDPEVAPLRLAPVQEAIIDRRGPLLIQGVAGSGKSTMLTQMAARIALASHTDETVLLLVYQDALKSYVETLLLAFPDARLTGRIDVLTYAELCRRQARLVDAPLELVNSLGRVSEILRVKRRDAGLSHQITLPELLDEMRSSIKGRNLDAGSELVPLEKYLSSHASTVHVPNGLKASIYAIATAYQQYLRNRNEHDDMDAARILWNERHRLERWAWVLVDEAQDYTLAQLALAASLAVSPEHVVFAGDENQVVYASQFTWERAREALALVGWSHSPDLQVIAANYRNPRPVQMIARELLGQRAERLALEVPLSGETDRPQTPRPLRAAMPLHDLDSVIARIAGRVPSLAVLFATPKLASRHAGALESARIPFRRGFTPQSVKGLEAEVVCLVGFGERYRDLATGAPHRSPTTEMFRFNEVYVSLTRPRRLLVMLDAASRHQQLWDDPRYARHYDRVDDVEALVEHIAAEASASLSGWRFAAMDFERRQFFEPAAECWEYATDLRRAGVCMESAGRLEDALRLYRAAPAPASAAVILERLERYAEAATTWEQTGGHITDAARCLERCEDYQRAAELWARGGHIEQHCRARARWLEQCGDSAGACDLWTRVGDVVNAARTAEEAGQFDRAAELWTVAGEPERAVRARARACEEASRWTDAAEAWGEVADWARAGECFERAGELQRAGHAWQRAGDELRASRLLGQHYEAHGRLEQAAEQFDRAHAYKHAASLWAAAGNDRRRWASIARQRSSNGRSALAAEAWERAGEPQLAATAWQEASRYDRAAELYETVPDHAGAAACWEVAKHWDRAERAWTRAGEPRRATQARALLLEQTRRFREAGELWESLGESQRAAAAHETGGDLAAALRVWWKTGATASEDYRRAEERRARIGARLGREFEKELHVLARRVLHAQRQVERLERKLGRAK